jgi:hypothetical protein
MTWSTNWFLIRTFKEHFVAGLSSVDPSFPLHLWDILLPQVEITLNLLRTSRLHPQLSTVAHFHGLVDYNKTYFAPPGYKIIAHEKPGKRRTWAPHGQHGYYVGPAMHHFRCQNVYISATASERIVDTLEFFPHNYQMPQLSSTDRLIMAVNDMSNALENPHPEVPFTHIRDDFQKQVPKISHSRTFSCTCQGRSTHMPRRIIQSNLSFSHSSAAPKKITNNNSRSRHIQHAITPEGGHTNGHCPHGHLPGKLTLVPAAPIQCSCSPNHQKRNGIHGPHERPSPATTLETRFWQRRLTAKSFLITNHIKRKRTRQVNCGRRQAGLLRRRRNFHSRHHDIQNPNQQHPFHRRCSYDGDGHKKLLFGHSIAMV